MTVRELVVLGTASQVPTRRRNHNGYLLRWDGEGVLFDPGEGTQRQLSLAGVAASTITHICITHFHGDHCLGLPGVLQRMSVDGVAHPVHLHFPAGGADYVDRLRHASAYHDRVELVLHPVTGDGPAGRIGEAGLHARRLDHGVETYGWRLQEPDGRHMVPERLAAVGAAGPAVGELQRAGRLELGGRVVTLEEVSTARPGQSFAFVMDTRECRAADDLAAGADLLVCESTFLDRDAELAREYGHLTAAQAGRIAARAGARRLVLTHFSQRYDDPAAYGVQAAPYADDVWVADDLDRVAVPKRR